MSKFTQLQGNDQSSVELRYLFKGEVIDPDYLKEHPELESLYMPQSRVNVIYDAARACTIQGFYSRIDVTENGVSYSVNLKKSY